MRSEAAGLGMNRSVWPAFLALIPDERHMRCPPRKHGSTRSRQAWPSSYRLVRCYHTPSCSACPAQLLAKLCITDEKLQAEVSQRAVHRPRQPWGHGPLACKTQRCVLLTTSRSSSAPACVAQALLRIRPQPRDDFSQGKAFPRRSHLRMALQGLTGRNGSVWSRPLSAR